MIEEPQGIITEFNWLNLLLSRADHDGLPRVRGRRRGSADAGTPAVAAAGTAPLSRRTGRKMDRRTRNRRE
jgi:hypothetical protein